VITNVHRVKLSDGSWLIHCDVTVAAMIEFLLCFCCFRNRTWELLQARRQESAAGGCRF